MCVKWSKKKRSKKTKKNRRGLWRESDWQSPRLKESEKFLQPAEECRHESAFIVLHRAAVSYQQQPSLKAFLSLSPFILLSSHCPLIHLFALLLRQNTVLDHGYFTVKEVWHSCMAEKSQEVDDCVFLSRVWHDYGCSLMPACAKWGWEVHDPFLLFYCYYIFLEVSRKSSMASSSLSRPVSSFLPLEEEGGVSMLNWTAREHNESSPSTWGHERRNHTQFKCNLAWAILASLQNIFASIIVCRQTGFFFSTGPLPKAFIN